MDMECLYCLLRYRYQITSFCQSTWNCIGAFFTYHELSRGVLILIHIIYVICNIIHRGTCKKKELLITNQRRMRWYLPCQQRFYFPILIFYVGYLWIQFWRTANITIFIVDRRVNRRSRVYTKHPLCRGTDFGQLHSRLFWNPFCFRTCTNIVCAHRSDCYLLQKGIVQIRFMTLDLSFPLGANSGILLYPFCQAIFHALCSWIFYILRWSGIECIYQKQQPNQCVDQTAAPYSAQCGNFLHGEICVNVLKCII